MSLVLHGTDGVTFNDSSLQGAAASPYTLKNKLINGDMRVDQRNAGASVSINTLAGGYTLDRWFATGKATAGVFTVQRLSASAPTGFTNYLACTTTTSATPGATDAYVFGQFIEGFNVADLGWGTANAQTVTLSFRVYSSLTGTFGGSVANNAANRCYPFSFSIASANTWTTISITIAGDTTGTWTTDNTAGIKLYFDLGSGSSLRGTAGSWGGTFYTGVTSATNVIATSGATFYITGVQLEQNTSATPFERRLYNQELANCQRYYQIIKMVSFGLWVSATKLRVFPAFKATMRTTPTMYLLTSTPYAEQISSVGITGSGSTITDYSNTREDGADVSVDGFSGRAYGQFAFIFFNTLAVGAEL